MRHANTHYKDAYVRAFEERVLPCVGPAAGGPCPHCYKVDMEAAGAGDSLKSLDLDHEQPVHRTCAQWSTKLPKTPAAWDDGIDGMDKMGTW